MNPGLSIYEWLIGLGCMLLCLACQAFFSGSEMGMISADKAHLRHRAAAGGKGAALALKMLDKPEQLLSITLVGTNLSLVINTTIATWLVVQSLGTNWSVLSVLVLAPFIWILGEIVPKSVFQQKSGQMAPVAVFGLWFFSLAFAPITLITSGFTYLLNRMIGVDLASKHTTLREEIRQLVEAAPHTKDIKPQEQAMIKRLFDFHETTAREIMIPLVDVVTINDDVTCRELMRTASKAYHKIIPVHSGRVDNMIGYVDTISLIGVPPEKPIKDMIQPISYAPDGKSIDTMLVDMRKADQRLVVVVDEFGGAEGIVTLEDILEVVVDEVRDEYDANEKDDEITRVSDNEYILSPRISLDELEELLGYNLVEDDINATTISGLLLELFGDIPKKGDSIRYQNLTFSIEAARPQAIDKVRMRVNAPEGEPPMAQEGVREQGNP